ncbi:MAG: hypothetical protein ROM54_00590 [Anaerobiospirillum sp.]|nr:hypothetical protein [Anaerobiospirillum sp.]
MDTLTPPSELIEALGTQNITSKRTRKINTLLRRAEEFDPDSYDLIFDLADVVLRLEPDFAENWMEYAGITLDSIVIFTNAGDWDEVQRLRTDLFDHFLFIIVEQQKPFIEALPSLLTLTKNNPNIQRIRVDPAIPAWLDILDFYRQTNRASEEEQENLDIIVPWLGNAIATLLERRDQIQKRNDKSRKRPSRPKRFHKNKKR